jgi:hypothetical protein
MLYILGTGQLAVNGLEFAAVCGRVFAHVNDIRIRKNWLGLPLLTPKVPGNHFRQEILVKVNAMEADLPPGRDQQLILGGSGYKL